jgi:hypothetical protein
LRSPEFEGRGECRDADDPGDGDDGDDGRDLKIEPVENPRPGTSLGPALHLSDTRSEMLSSWDVSVASLAVFR